MSFQLKIIQNLRPLYRGNEEILYGQGVTAYEHDRSETAQNKSGLRSKHVVSYSDVVAFLISAVISANDRKIHVYKEMLFRVIVITVKEPLRIRVW